MVALPMSHSERMLERFCFSLLPKRLKKCEQFTTALNKKRKKTLTTFSLAQKVKNFFFRLAHNNWCHDVSFGFPLIFKRMITSFLSFILYNV